MARGSKQAYFHVDITEFPKDVRDTLVEDASMGGAQYGLRVVELIHNGPAQAPIYGVYYGDDEVKFKEGLAELAAEYNGDEEVDLTEDAERKAAEQAAAQLAAEEAAIAEIDKGAEKRNGKR